MTYHESIRVLTRVLRSDEIEALGRTLHHQSHHAQRHMEPPPVPEEPNLHPAIEEFVRRVLANIIDDAQHVSVFKICRESPNRMLRFYVGLF
jgi:hypothetical protein